MRKKTGQVARCIWHRRPGDSTPIELHDYMGKGYSIREHLHSGRRCWKLKRPAVAMNCGRFSCKS